MKVLYTLFIIFLFSCSFSQEINSLQNDSLFTSAELDQQPVAPGILFLELSKLSSDTCFCDKPSFYTIVFDSQGNIIKLNLLRGTSECLDQKIETIIRNSSPWSSGIKNDKAVSCIITFPVRLLSPISIPCK